METTNTSSLSELTKSVDKYESYLADKYWALTPEHEGDVLYLCGLRDEVHDNYDRLQKADGINLEPIAQRIRALDSDLQNYARTSKSPDFKMAGREKDPEWWNNLDILDDFTPEELRQI